MTLNILTWNIFIVPNVLKKGQYERVPLILRWLKDNTAHVDVLICQEVFEFQTKILNGLKDIGFTFITNNVTSTSKPLNSGVFIASKYPIVNQNFHVFENCFGSDCLASKAVVFAKIQFQDTFVNLVATHLQAFDSNDAMKARQKQLSEIENFIKHQNISKNELVVIAGDFNTDQIDTDLLNATPVPLSPHSQQYTFDPSSNQLVGLDTIGDYRSNQFPTGCQAAYLQHLYCACCSPSLYDHILIHNDYKKPPSQSSILRPKSSQPYVAQITSKTRRMFNGDLSDHYPVFASIYIIDDDHTPRAPPAASTHDDDPRTATKTTTAIATTVTLVVVIVMTTIVAFYGVKNFMGKEKKNNSRLTKKNMSNHHHHGRRNTTTNTIIIMMVVIVFAVIGYVLLAPSSSSTSTTPATAVVLASTASPATNHAFHGDHHHHHVESYMHGNEQVTYTKKIKTILLTDSTTTVDLSDDVYDVYRFTGSAAASTTVDVMIPPVKSTYIDFHLNTTTDIQIKDPLNSTLTHLLQGGDKYYRMFIFDNSSVVMSYTISNANSASSS